MGNIKSPELKAEKINAAKLAHEAEDAARILKAHDRAALNPLTAEILVIGLKGDAGQRDYLIGDEKIMLRNFWDTFINPQYRDQPFIFWSGNGAPTENFDPDFIIRRSWILGVKVPVSAFNDGYLSRRFVDATRRYVLGDRMAFCSLTDAADELGLYGPGSTLFPKTKDDPVTGKNFWEWWQGLMPADRGTPEQQQEQAKRYLDNDVDTLAAIVERIF